MFDGALIAFFSPHPCAATNSTLVSLIRRLQALGAEIHIYAPFDPRGPQLDIGQYPFPYHYCPRDSLRKQVTRKILRVFSGEKVFSNALKTNHYDLVFGVDSFGVIAAHGYSAGSNVPYIYLSFELLFRDELTTDNLNREKDLEILACQAALFTVIQDKKRMEYLCAENNISSDDIVLLPVSPSKDDPSKDSNYLRDKYNIPNSNLIMLHSGSFNNWSFASELVKLTDTIPDDITLVVNVKNLISNKYALELKEKSRDNIILTNGALDEDEYNEMVASADVGLALYKPIRGSYIANKNLKYIGLSSGKFSIYAKYGLPIISVNQECYRELLNDYQFGIDVDKIDDLIDAMTIIKKDYEKYSIESRKIYDEKLKFDLYWPVIEQRINEGISGCFGNKS